MNTANTGPRDLAGRTIQITSTPSGLDQLPTDPETVQRLLANASSVVQLRSVNDADAAHVASPRPRIGSINTKVQLRSEVLADTQSFDPAKRST